MGNPATMHKTSTAIIRLLALVALLLLTACDDGAPAAPAMIGHIGDASRGADLIVKNGCGACHIIPGIKDASGLVGPPLNHIARRIYVAGVLRNSPRNMQRWLRNPQAIVPGNAMPNFGFNERDAANISAYLYTLR